MFYSSTPREWLLSQLPACILGKDLFILYMCWSIYIQKPCLGLLWLAEHSCRCKWFSKTSRKQPRRNCMNIYHIIIILQTAIWFKIIERLLLRLYWASEWETNETYKWKLHIRIVVVHDETENICWEHAWWMSSSPACIAPVFTEAYLRACKAGHPLLRAAGISISPIVPLARNKRDIVWRTLGVCLG